MDVFGIEADFFQYPNRFGENLVADAISGHAYDGMFCHESSSLKLLISIANYRFKSALSFRQSRSACDGDRGICYSLAPPQMQTENRFLPPVGMTIAGFQLAIGNCQSQICYASPNLFATRFSTPCAITSDCGTL